MATTPITKVASPANSTGVTIFGEGGVNNSPWEAVPSGSGNGVTFTFNDKDLVLLGNTINNATRTFTILTPEPDGLSAYSSTVSSGSLTVAANDTAMALRISEVFKGSANLVTIEANASGGVIMVIEKA